MELSLRRARADDADRAGALYVRARRAAAALGTIPPATHADDEVADWMQRVVLASRECWLALSPEGAAVGILVLDGEWIDQLYVDPRLTGQGIGAVLLELAKRERPAGLRLWTFASNAAAQRFYLRHGFAEVTRTSGAHNEERAPDIQYEWAG